MIALIAVTLFVVQVTLGVSMIATASVASNRHINAANRSFDVVLRVIGRASVALGAWGLIASIAPVALMGASGNLTLGLWFLCVVVTIYSLFVLVGGWLQAGVASFLIDPPPIEVQRKQEWRMSLLRGIGWTLALMPFGPLAGIYFGIIAVMGATVRLQQESLLLILAIAMRTRAPLAEEIEALADGSRGRFRKRLRELAQRLRNGDRLSDALEALPGLAPSQTITAIRVGEDLGNTIPVIQQEALRLRRREQSRLQGRLSFAGLVFYVCCVLFVTNSIVLFLSFWIVPKFKKIFADFGAEVPPMTNRVIQAADAASTLWPTILIWTVLLVGGPLILLLRRGGWAGFDWSVLSGLYPRMETPGVLRSLANAISVRRPLATALAGLEFHHRRRHVRRRIRSVRDDVARGRDCFDLLHQSGLLSSREAAALVSAEKSGNLGWALEGIATNIEGSQQARAQAFVEMVQPTVIFALGLLIFFICVAFFFPLVQLINTNVTW